MTEELFSTEIETKCEIDDPFTGAPCPVKAAWFMVRVCCRSPMALCDDHRMIAEMVLDIGAEMHNEGGGLDCNNCGFGPVTRDDIIWEAI